MQHAGKAFVRATVSPVPRCSIKFFRGMIGGVAKSQAEATFIRSCAYLISIDIDTNFSLRFSHARMVPQLRLG